MKWIVALLLAFLSGCPLPNANADEAKPIPNFKLVDQENRPFQLHDLKGHYVLLSFVYTRCPMADMCPRTLSLMKDLIAKSKEQPGWKQSGFPLKVLAVTLDPSYDTPEIMKSYAESQGLTFDKFTFATGQPKDLVDLESHFNVLGIEGQGSVSHTMKAVLLSPLMVPLREYKDNDWTPGIVLNDMAGSVAWWKWFYVFSAMLAIPGLFLLWLLRGYTLEAPSNATTPQPK
jgi:cytochrome oxidase Cu insertion factor (SCO1/SenC/PrrC family)